MRNNTTRQFIKLSKQRMDGWDSNIYRHFDLVSGRPRAAVIALKSK